MVTVKELRELLSGYGDDEEVTIELQDGQRWDLLVSSDEHGVILECVEEAVLDLPTGH